MSTRLQLRKDYNQVSFEIAGQQLALQLAEQKGVLTPDERRSFLARIEALRSEARYILTKLNNHEAKS